MATRTTAHALIRRRSDGKYLILKGSVWPERPDRSEKSDIPGGMVEANESIKDGCEREIFEETSITLDKQSLQLVYEDHHSSITSPGMIFHRHFFLSNIDDAPDIRLSWEHIDYRWMTFDEILESDMREPFKKILRTIKQTHGDII